jgi:competence protein ComEC
MPRAPAAFLAVAVCSGLVIARELTISIYWAAGLFVVVLLVAAAAFRVFAATSATRQLTLFIACMLLGALRYALVQVDSPDAVHLFASSETPVILSGEVISAPLKGRTFERRASKTTPAYVDTLWRCTLEARAVRLSTEKKWQPVVGAVLASGTRLDSLDIGEKVLLSGELLIPDGERNPGEFNYREYLAAQGINALLRCRDANVLWQQPADGFSWRQHLQRVREYVSRQIHRFASGDEAALIRGLLLGEREDISEEVHDAFVRTGLIHILAVSGSHVGFVLLMVLALGDVLRMPKPVKTLFASGALIFFAALTGFNPPVTRATVMALIFLGGKFIERDGSVYNMLALAALVILLDEPRQLYQLGFQLSFAAVLGMAYLYQPILNLLSRPFAWLGADDRVPEAIGRAAHSIASLLALTIAAQIATAPIIAHAFGRVPALAIWGNLPIIPLAFWIVASATTACLIMPFWSFGGAAFGAAADFGASAMVDFTRWLADTPAAYADGILFTLPAIVLFILGLVTVVEWRSTLRRMLLPSFLLIANFMIWQSASSATEKLRVTFFDIGQGDAALLEFAGGKKLLIDGGPRQPAFDTGSRTIVPFLMRQGIRHLDAIVVTHPHNDHDGGVPEVLRRVRVDSVFHCGMDDDPTQQSYFEHILDSLKAPHRALSAGERLRQFGSIEVLVLHPPRHSIIPSLNDASVVMRIVCGRVSFLFAGDAETWAESYLTRFDSVLDSDVLKVGHHGSSTSSSPEFIAEITPAWAVVSVGKRNRFDHPSPEVIHRLRSSGAQVVRLDENGAVIFATDGINLRRER